MQSAQPPQGPVNFNPFLDQRFVVEDQTDTLNIPGIAGPKNLSNDPGPDTRRCLHLTTTLLKCSEKRVVGHTRAEKPFTYCLLPVAYQNGSDAHGRMVLHAFQDRVIQMAAMITIDEQHTLADAQAIRTALIGCFIGW